MSYFVHCDWSLLARQAFHPKLYITTADYQRYCAIVGSSNLTLGGLRSNVEVNAVIRGDDSEEPVRRCLDTFDSILASPALLEPDLEFAEKYAHLYERAGDLPLTLEPPSDLAPLYEDLAALWHREPKTDVVWPRTQTDFVAQAIVNLTAGDVEAYAHLSAIYAEAERLARAAGVTYDWGTFDNSVQGPAQREHGRPGRPGPLRAPGRAVERSRRVSAFTQGTGLRRTSAVSPLMSYGGLCVIQCLAVASFIRAIGALVSARARLVLAEYVHDAV